MKSIQNALLSLDGLSVGDAFGAALGEGHTSAEASQCIANRLLPPSPWRWTDDTHMALSIVEILSGFEAVEQDELARRFARRFTQEPHRGYGGGAIRILQQINDGGDWKKLAPHLFDGGSYGNGGAMRAAPIGGYFKGEPERAAEEARKSAMITHAHPEGQAGAIAVAVAAVIAADANFRNKDVFLSEVLKYVPAGKTYDGIRLAKQIPRDDFETAVNRLGAGWQVSAQDTVPFCLWCVAHNPDNFEAALWTTAAGGGDRDTTSAIVGGIMAISTGEVPQEWLTRREPLPKDFEVKK